MFISTLSLAALVFIPVAFAQCLAPGILQAFNASGLDQLAADTASLNGTSGQYILTELSQGNKIIFGPSDHALSSVGSGVINNSTSFADLIAYHIVSSDFINQTQTYPNVTIGRTLLNASDLVMLEGNRSQVLVWSKFDNGTLFVQNQGSNITVANTTFVNDSAILAIDSVLIPPPNISTILNNASYDLTSTASILQSTTTPNGISLLDLISSAHGITLFAPNNAGVQAAQSSLAGISNNSAELLDVVSNHVINGTTLYSTEISNQTTIVSAGGQRYIFVSNSTGLFVSVGGSNQVQILQRNILASNGVVYVVDGVMLNTNSNAALASSAFASATSVAAHATQTGPVESTPTPTTVSRAAGREVSNWNLWMLTGIIFGVVQFA